MLAIVYSHMSYILSINNNYEMQPWYILQYFLLVRLGIISELCIPQGHTLGSRTSIIRTPWFQKQAG